jgi:uncharacterized protein YjbJ (UPF0337 family)
MMTGTVTPGIANDSSSSISSIIAGSLRCDHLLNAWQRYRFLLLADRGRLLTKDEDERNQLTFCQVACGPDVPVARATGGSSMDEDRIEGAARNFAGKLEDAVGAVTGDKATQARGQANRAAGAVQNAYGQAVDGVRDFASDQPLVALLSAMGIGVVIGLLLNRN